MLSGKSNSQLSVDMAVIMYNFFLYPRNSNSERGIWVRPLNHVSEVCVYKTEFECHVLCHQAL
jgi:hypothetical protein